MDFDVKSKILSITEETPDVKTLRLEKHDVDFAPGQYLLASLPEFEDIKDEERPFTFASSPLKNYIEVTIKKFGRITTIIHENLHAQDYIRLRGPFGEALTFDQSAKKIVLVAGGSGITPFKSIIDYVIDKNLENELILLFSNMTEKDIIYRKQFDTIHKKNIRIVHTLTSERPAEWDGEIGYVDQEMIKRNVPNYKDWLYYICGPPQMIAAVKKALSSIGVTETMLRIEDWMLPGKHDAQKIA